MVAAAHSAVFDTAELAGAMREVIAAVQRRNTIPILSNVLLDVAPDGTATATATDLDVLARRQFRAAAASAKFAFTLDANRLVDVLGAFDKGSQTEITLAENGAIVKSGRARLRFATLPAENFPILARKDEAASFQISPKALRRGFNSVRHAICNEPTRYYLNGVYWHPFDGKLRFVATDGHRLARVIDDLPPGASRMPASIVRTATVAFMVNAAEERDCDIAVLIGDSKIEFTADNFTLVSKLVDGTFPDYTRVFPPAPKCVALVDRDALVAAAARVAKASDERTGATKLTFSPQGTLLLEVNSQMHGLASDEIACEFDGKEPFQVAFNLRYLRDALDALTVDTVKFELVDSGSPTIVTSAVESGLTLILVPMRI